MICNSEDNTETPRAGLKICIACSPGGHMIQARRLAVVYDKYNHFYFTFSGEMAKQLQKSVRVRTIPNIFRNKPASVALGFILSAYYALLERPHVVISTGASVVVFFCIFAKMFGAKLIFIESMAKVDKPTLTAKLLYPFTDLFIVQWPGLLRFFPKARFLGRLL